MNQEVKDQFTMALEHNPALTVADLAKQFHVTQRQVQSYLEMEITAPYADELEQQQEVQAEIRELRNQLRLKNQELAELQRNDFEKEAIKSIDFVATLLEKQAESLKDSAIFQLEAHGEDSEDAHAALGQATDYAYHASILKGAADLIRNISPKLEEVKAIYLQALSDYVFDSSFEEIWNNSDIKKKLEGMK